MVPYNNHYEPQTWKRITTSEGKTHALVRSASIIAFTCPNGHTFPLTDYEIIANGSVHPSVLCAERCGFTEFITLQGWSAHLDLLSKSCVPAHVS